MTGIRLSQLRDRTPVRLTVSLSPELNQLLGRYVRFYQAEYGKEESATDLAVAMIEAFIDSDKAFSRWRRETANGQE